MIVFDTETAPISPGNLAPDLVCVQFTVDDGPVGIAVRGVDSVETLCDAVLSDSGPIVGHNVAYDLLVIMRAYPSLAHKVFLALDEGRISCTMVREKLLRIADGTLQTTRSFSLAALAERYGFSKNANDPWRLRYSELLGVPFSAWPEDAQSYARHDVEVTRGVYVSQAQEGVSPDEARQVRAAFALHCVGASGIYTDPVAVNDFVAMVHEDLRSGEASLKTAGFVRSDGTRDTKVASAYMLALDPHAKRTPAGGICLDEDACLATGDPLLKAYQIYGSSKTLLGRLEALRNPLINPGFDSLVASGRTSCRDGGSAAVGYQVQNVRRGAGERECFVPGPGECIVACDYSAFELCALSQVCLDLFGQSALASAIRAGTDPHLLLAAKTLGIPYVDAEERKEDPEIKNARQVAKAANFGYPGGLGYEGFRSFARGYGIELGSDESCDLREDWFRTWPEMHGFFEWIALHTYTEIRRKKGTVNITTVRQLRSERVRGGCTYTSACNTMFQGLAADAAKEACYAAVKATEIGSLKGWRIWNFVHDEILMRGPVGDCDRAARELERIMVAAGRNWIPDVPIVANPTAMDRWSKSAKLVLDPEGRIVPCIIGGGA